VTTVREKGVTRRFVDLCVRFGQVEFQNTIGMGWSSWPYGYGVAATCARMTTLIGSMPRRQRAIGHALPPVIRDDGWILSGSRSPTSGHRRSSRSMPECLMRISARSPPASPVEQQYRLVERAVLLGWPQERVHVVLSAFAPVSGPV
jgi:hypothetical protein